jgi:hypothetical protein
VEEKVAALAASEWLRAFVEDVVKNGSRLTSLQQQFN